MLIVAENQFSRKTYFYTIASRTPEEQFLGQKATSKFDLPEFDPKSVDRDTPILETKGARLIGDAPEVRLVQQHQLFHVIVEVYLIQR